MTEILLVITGVLTALLAGVFFGYSVSVNGGLHRLDDKAYVQAMQHINVVIINPLFMLTFMGPVALLPLVTWLTWSDGTMRSMLLAAASFLYIVGVFAVTGSGNVQLNNQLATVDAESADVAEARKRFEPLWNRLHTIRTVAAVLATVLVFAAGVTHG